MNQTPDRWRVVAGAGLITALAALAYLPALNGGFVLDDDLLLTDNALIKAPDGLYRFWFTTAAIDYWPVSSTTLWLEWRLWGMQPTGYHVTNLLLHIVTAWLFWNILRRLSVPGAFLAALLFAVHPVNVESVAWIAQRKGLLALLFLQLSVLAYLRSEDQSGEPSQAINRWYALSLAAFALAMLSKVSVAVLPLLLLGIVWWRRPLIRRDLLRITPFIVVAVALVRVTLRFRTQAIEGIPIQTATMTERLLGAGGVVWFYLSKALLPVHLVFMYPDWDIHTDQLRWWLPLLAAVATTVVLWRYRRTWGRPPLFAWGCFCVALVPVMGFTDVGSNKHLLVADHYQHVALIAVPALLAAGWSAAQQPLHGAARGASYAAAATVAAGLAVLTWQQSRLYVDATMLYRATLENNPDAWIAHNNLGLALYKNGELQAAIDHYQQALRLNPAYFDAYNNLGNALADLGRYPEAIERYAQALRCRPNSPDAHYNLGVVLAQAGEPRQAIAEYQEALRLHLERWEAHYSLATALAQVGDFDGAIQHFGLALRLNPDSFEAHYKLGLALAQSGRLAEVIEHLQEALRLRPDAPEVHYNLGNALAQWGRLHEAIEQFQQALRLKPDYPEAQANLDIALSLQREQQEQ